MTPIPRNHRSSSSCASSSTSTSGRPARKHRCDHWISTTMRPAQPAPRRAIRPTRPRRNGVDDEPEQLRVSRVRVVRRRSTDELLGHADVAGTHGAPGVVDRGADVAEFGAVLAVSALAMWTAASRASRRLNSRSRPALVPKIRKKVARPMSACAQCRQRSARQTNARPGARLRRHTAVRRFGAGAASDRRFFRSIRAPRRPPLSGFEA